MNIATRLAFVCILTLAACSQPAATPSTETAMPASTTPAEGVPTSAMLVGRWGDNGDCTRDVTFNADGTFLSYTGGSGRWTLEGDVLTMTGASGPMQVRVAIANENTLMIGQPDGTYGMSQRC